MLRRVAVADLTLGMFIQSLDCSWLDSPFWRTRFLLDDPNDLELLRNSNVTAVTVDDSRSVVVAKPAPAVAVAESVEDEPAAPIVVERRTRGRMVRPDEVARARETVERSKEAVSAMFAEARLGHAVNVTDVAPLVEEIAESMISRSAHRPASRRSASSCSEKPRGRGCTARGRFRTMS